MDDLLFLFFVAIGAVVLSYRLGKTAGREEVKKKLRGLKADALHDRANEVSQILPAAREAVNVGFTLNDQELIIQKYGAVLQQPGPMFRQESELPFPKEVIRKRLIEALLHHELDEKMRNALEFGYVDLETYLPRDEFDIVKPFSDILRDETTLDYVERVKRGEDHSAETIKLVEKIKAAPDCRAVYDKICERQKLRLYELRVFKSIVAGETDPNMARLIKEADEAVKLKDK